MLFLLLACSPPRETPDSPEALPACVTDVDLYAGCGVTIEGTYGEIGYTRQQAWGPYGLEAETRTSATSTSEWLYTWDDRGLLLAARGSQDGELNHLYDYTYDEAGLLLRFDRWTVDMDSRSYELYTYYPDGWLQRVELYGEDDGAVTTTEYTWETTEDGRVGESITGANWHRHVYDVREQLVWQEGATTDDTTDIDWTRSWERDEVCLVTAFQESPGRRETYTRDADGRLLQLDLVWDDNPDDPMREVHSYDCP